MKNLRCSKCNSLLAKEEEGKLILRTGFGKRQVFHVLEVRDGTLTCWFCKEIINIGRNGNGKT